VKRMCVVSVLLLLLAMTQSLFADALSDLARPQTGRSMRETSTHKTGPDGKYDPNGEPDPDSNTTTSPSRRARQRS